MWLLLILVIIISFLLIYMYFKKTYRIRKILADMPCPVRSFPLIGCVLELGTNPEDVFRNLTNIISKYGPTGAAWVGPEAFIAISSPECFEAILSNKKFNNKPFIYDFLSPYLGLVVASGEKWRRKRKILTPAFHFQILDNFIDDFNSNAVILVQNLRKEVGNPGFDVHHYLGLCTLDIIAESSMGVKVNAQSEAHVSFNDAIIEAAFAVQTRVYKPWYFVDWIYRLSQHSRTFEKNKNIVENFIVDVIKRKKEQRIQQKLLKESEDNNIENKVPGKKKYMAFLDTLLENMDNGVQISEEDLKYEVTAFMITGQHTITEAVSFTLYSLMKNPEVQEKVIKELDDFFGKSDRMPTNNDIQELKYLDKVVKETLRMYPPVPLMFRSVSEDFRLPDGYTAPEGTTFLLSTFNLHYNSKIYQDPYVFNPERFEPETANQRHPFSFCPFSAGARNCIGQRFAMIQIKVLVSTILRNFRIVPPIEKPDVQLSIGVVLTSSTGVNVRLVER